MRDFKSLRARVETEVKEWFDRTGSKVEDIDVVVEGESKKIRSIELSVLGHPLALVELKPTLYSFTHNRYGEVPGSDISRYKFWSYLVA